VTLRRTILLVRVTLDRAADRAYIYLKDFEDAEAARQHVVSDHFLHSWLTLDFDKSGRLLGIEAAKAASSLPKELLDEAERV